MSFDLVQITKAANYWLAEIVSHSRVMQLIFNETCLDPDVYQYLSSRVHQKETSPKKRRFSEDIFKTKEAPIPYDRTKIDRLLNNLRSLSEQGNQEARMALDFHSFLKGTLTQRIYNEQLETSYIPPLDLETPALQSSQHNIDDSVEEGNSVRLINLTPSPTGDKTLAKQLGMDNNDLPDLQEVLGLNYSQIIPTLEECLNLAEFKPHSLTHLPAKTMIIYENGGIEVLEKGKSIEVLISVPNEARLPGEIPAQPTQHGFDEESLAQLMPYLKHPQGVKGHH